MHKFARISDYCCTSLLDWRNFDLCPAPRRRTWTCSSPVRCSATSFSRACRCREPGAEVYAEAFKLTPGGVANRAVAGSRMGARTALLSQLGDDPLGLHMVAVLSAEPDLDLTWLRCTPGFQSPVTVSLTGMHEREFITYQEEADPLEWPIDRPSVGATHVSMQRDLPDWVARLRQRGHGDLRRRGLGLQRHVVPRGARPARPDRRLRAQRRRSHALHPDRRCVRRRPRARSLRRAGRRHPGRARGHRVRARPPAN